MKKTYTVRPYRLILNLLFGLLGSVALGFFIGLFLDGIYAYVIGAIMFLLYLWLVFFDNLLTVIIDGDRLIIKKGKDSRSYVISECEFRGGGKKNKRTDSSYVITVILPNGEEDPFDCLLLGKSQFRDILKDLGIVGNDGVPSEMKSTKEE